MGAPLDGAQVDALLLHLLRRLHFREKMKVFSGLLTVGFDESGDA